MLKIVFMGTPEFSVPILDALNKKYEVIGVVTQPDKQVGRKKQFEFSPVKTYAIENNLKIFQPEKIRKDYQDIINLEPDLIVTAAYGQIIGTKLLFSPKYKSINVHGSLLPLYRGGAPIQQAIKDGQEFTGITIMYMSKGMDSGDILSQEKVRIGENETADELFKKLSIVGRDLLMKTIPDLISNKITPIVQDESKVTFAYNVTKEEEQINFQQDARDVHNHIRAYSTNPGAYMILKGEIIKIYRSAVSKVNHSLEPGTIFNISKNGFSISCGNGTAIDVLELQISGKKKVSANEAVNGALRKFL